MSTTLQSKLTMSPQAHAQLAADSNAVPTIKDGVWRDFAEIDETRWNKSYPYQLLVLETAPDGGYSVKDGWQFTLPIPPEALTISTPFPTHVDAALEGVVEQNAPVRFRHITMRGTTGVLPLRPTGTGTPDNPGGTVGLADSIFAGTISSAGRTADAASAAIAGKVRTAVNLLSDSFSTGSFNNSDIPSKGTGYFQFLLLERFFLAYANEKTKDSGKRLRLALAVWKTNTIYLVQPTHFETSKDASSPHEQRYLVRFKTWGKIDPNSLNTPQPVIIRAASGKDPALLSEVLGRINDARNTLAGANRTITSVRSDIARNVFETLRQTAFFCKDALGIAPTLADLPVGIGKDFHDLFSKQSPSSIENIISNASNQTDIDVRTSLQRLGFISTTPSGALTGSGTGQRNVGSSTSVFVNQEDNIALLSALRPDMLNLPTTTQKKIAAERARVAAFTRLDFEHARDALIRASVEFSDAIGAGSDTYNAIYGRTAVAKKNKAAPSDDDWATLFALNEAAMQVGRLASYADVGTDATSPMEYIAGLATQSGITFTVPNSKFAVPFPYGATLEQLAARYLGSVDRWMEIAALNSLRAPYVDEVGFDLPLLAPARGNTVVVASAANLYLGQAVWLQGTGLASQKRHIQALDEVQGHALVVLEADVDGFTPTASATLHAYLPNTVNSQMLIFIPSSEQATDDGNTKDVPGIDKYDHLLRVGGMDLLLSEKRDIVIGNDADCRIAQGLANIIQIANINFNLPRGRLLRHPNLGIYDTVGTNSGDVSAQDMLVAAKSSLSAYSMFDSVRSVLITRSGPSEQIGVAVAVKGVDDLLKITVDVEQ